MPCKDGSKKSCGTKSAAKPAAKPAATKSTPVRKTTVPKAAKSVATAAAVAAPAPKVITHDDIARRAYEIWASGQGGSEYDNWVRAEHELRNA